MTDLDRRLEGLFAEQPAVELPADFEDRVLARLPDKTPWWKPSPRRVLALYWVVASLVALWALGGIGWSLNTMAFIAGAALVVLLPLALLLRSAGVALSDLFVETVGPR